MTTIEKKMLVAVGVLIVCAVVSVKSCTSAIENAGGMRAVIVETGKEIKEIKKEIDEE